MNISQAGSRSQAHLKWGIHFGWHKGYNIVHSIFINHYDFLWLQYAKLLLMTLSILSLVSYGFNETNVDQIKLLCANHSFCNIIAEGFRFMRLGLVRLRTFRLSRWVS